METATDDDVEAESVVASPSSLHATSMDPRNDQWNESRRASQWQVWHASWRLPDQGVGLVATFNKL